MRILLAPNSFKNSLLSVEVTIILSQEFSFIENVEIVKSPLSDGGDGFLEVIKFNNEKEIIEKKVAVVFAEQIFDVPLLYKISTKEIFIESAEVVGLKKITSEKRNPLTINTLALGNIISDLVKQDVADFPEVNKIVIGVGGTATIDLGLGALSALGVRFLGVDGNELLPIPQNFCSIREIDSSNSFIPLVKLTIKQSLNHSITQSIKPPEISCIVDVETKLLGEKNAVEMFGYQKGASKNEIEFIKKGLENVLSILKKDGFQFNELDLNGAGGGLAAGLNLFLGASIISAEDFIKNNILKFSNSCRFDYVITSEGKLDIQSFEGKATGEVIRMFHPVVKKIFVICGLAENDVIRKLPQNVDVIELKNYFSSIEESIDKTSEGLRMAAKEIIRKITFN
jgi:glycerate kinase